MSSVLARMIIHGDLSLITYPYYWLLFHTVVSYTEMEIIPVRVAEFWWISRILMCCYWMTFSTSISMKLRWRRWAGHLLCIRNELFNQHAGN